MRLTRTKTPLRISLAGGFTDIPDFYEKFGGEVITTTINQFISIYFTGLPNKKVVLCTQLGREDVDDGEKIEHPIVREALKLTGVRHGISIRVESDVSPHGCGLGTSSALAVGLLQGLVAFLDKWRMSADELARDACNLEIEKCGSPIGKQDQYITAYGGVKHIIFHKCGDVQVEDIPIYPETLKDLRNNLMLFDTGVERSASRVMGKHDSYERLKNQLEIKKLVMPMYDVLTNPYENLDEVGLLFHKHWGLKREVSMGTYNPLIDKVYNTAILFGALGGRLLGAGGGGHFLFYVPVENQYRVAAELGHLGLKQIPFQFWEKGSELYDSDYPVCGEGYSEASGFTNEAEDTIGL